MRTDLRVKHDVEARRRAAAALRLGPRLQIGRQEAFIPRNTVKKWRQIYRAFGSEVLLSMDGKQAVYTYEQKVAAAPASPTS